MLRKSVFFLMFGLFTAGHLAAQWNLINPLPTNNNLRDMIFLDATRGVAVGSNGTLLTTTNSGDTWNIRPTSSFTHLNSVASPHSSAIFICGDGGLLLKTDFTFSRIDTLASGMYGDLNKIRFLNHSVGFCIGNGRLVLKTTDGGNTWIPSRAGDRGDLLDLSFPNDSTGYITGRFYTPFSAYSANLLVTHNQGQSWELIDSLRFDVNAIWFTDSLTGYLASYELHKTTDGGKTWIEHNLPDDYFTGIFFRDKQNGWVINYEGYLAKTTDGGQVWNRITRMGTTNRILQLSQDSLIAYGMGGDIWRSHDEGTHWSRTGRGDRNSLAVIEFPDSKKGFILGDSVLYRTTDAGKHWQVESHPANNIDDGAFANSERGLALSWNGLWLTTDGAKSWNRVEISLPMAVFGCAFANDRTAYVSGVNYGHFFYDPVTLKSTDGGATWKKTPLPNNFLVRRFLFTGGGNGFAIGFSGGLFKTGNYGQSWDQVMGLPALTGFRKMCFPTRSTGYATGVYTTETGRPYNVICKSDDGGDHWSQVFREDTSFREAYAGVYFVDANTGYVAAIEGYILKTTNGGETWTKEFMTNMLLGIGGTGSRIWTIGAYGTILTNQDDSGLGTSESIPLENLINELFPNPFSTKTNFRLELPQESQVRITVTDLSGRLLDEFNLVLPKGESVWTYEGSRLPPGVYILNLTSGSGFSSARMLKINEE